ncbi:MAG: porphobilinogen synthase, partial [Spirochaetes bacterium]|nr:porphobilinogen synthase [Spirochaetota bacterium]
MGFPVVRMRRLRQNENMRRLVRETSLSIDDLIYPLFVRPGKNVKNEIKSMPGNYQMSVDQLIVECKKVRELGIPAVMLFGIPEKKDELGSEAYSDDGIIQKAVRSVKKEVPGLLIVTDVCFCE